MKRPTQKPAPAECAAIWRQSPAGGSWSPSRRRKSRGCARKHSRRILAQMCSSVSLPAWLGSIARRPPRDIWESAAGPREAAASGRLSGDFRRTIMRRMCFAIVGVAVTVVSAGGFGRRGSDPHPQEADAGEWRGRRHRPGHDQGRDPLQPGPRRSRRCAPSMPSPIPPATISRQAPTRATRSASPRSGRRWPSSRQYLANFQKDTDAARAAKPRDARSLPGRHGRYRQGVRRLP